MGLTDLLRALEEDGAARVAEVRAGARAEVLRVRAEGDAECEHRREAVLQGREVELRAAAARELDATRRQAAAAYLETRAEALARVYQRVRARLAGRAADPALLPILRTDLASALEYAGEGPVVVEAAPALLDGLRAAQGDAREVRLEGTRSDGGLVVRAPGGEWMVDATFDGRLRRAWPRLAIELAARLEPAP
jgi:vacuolar-type H+-ATPase subunit E/Vma4